jgi:hypothetical protein
MAGRPKGEAVTSVLLRIPPALLRQVERCKALLELQEGRSLTRTAAFWRILVAGCEALEPHEPPHQEPTLTLLQALPDNQAPPRRRGRSPGPLRLRILTTLAAHPEGLSVEQIRACLDIPPGTTIGDTLQGMRRSYEVRTRKIGKRRRYFAPRRGGQAH